MQFLHVTHLVKDLEQVNKYIKDGKHVFLFIHSESCGHCINAVPHWKQLKNRLAHKNRSDVLVADINQKVLSDVNKIMNVGNIEGYPTIKYIHGKKVKEFNQERTTDLFMNWIETNIGNAVSMNKTRKGQRGGSLFGFGNDENKVIENGDDTAIMRLETYLENVVKDKDYRYKWFQMPLNQNQNGVFTTFEILYAISVEKKTESSSLFSSSYNYEVKVGEQLPVDEPTVNEPPVDEGETQVGEPQVDETPITPTTTKIIGSKYKKTLDTIIKVYVNKPSNDETNKVYNLGNNEYEIYNRDGSSIKYNSDGKSQTGGKTRRNIKRSIRKRSIRKRSNRKRSDCKRK